MKTNSNAEVWLLETHYDDGMSYEELFIHIPTSSIWITDTGYSREHLENVEFTRIFWDKMYEEHLFTRLGDL